MFLLARRRAGRAAVHDRRQRRLDPVPRRQLDRPRDRPHRADRLRRPAACSTCTTRSSTSSGSAAWAGTCRTSTPSSPRRCCGPPSSPTRPRSSTTSLDLDEVVQRVVDQACRLVGAGDRVAAPHRRRRRSAPGRGAGRRHRARSLPEPAEPNDDLLEVVGQHPRAGAAQLGHGVGALRPARAPRAACSACITLGAGADDRFDDERRRAARPLRRLGGERDRATPSATKPRSSSSTADARGPPRRLTVSAADAPRCERATQIVQG